MTDPVIQSAGGLQNRPKVLSMGMAQAAAYDPKFMEAMPEFRTLQPKLAAMKPKLATGCGGCRKHRVAGNLYRDFMFVVMALDAEGKQRLRNYFGGTPLMMMRLNPKTKQYETIQV